MAKDGRVDDQAFSKRQDAFSNINPASSQPNTNRIGISVDPIRDIEMKQIADDGSWNSKDHRNGSTRNRGIAAAVLNDTSKAVLVWKAEWLELKADDGTPYYYNQRLKETAWEIPPMPDYFALTPPPPNGPISITLSKPPPYLPNDAQTRNRLKSQSGAGKLAPKDGSSSSRVGGEVSIISSITRTFLHARVPFSQQSIMDWIVFLVYASINLLAIYALDTSMNNAKKWGYSTAANLMIVTLPATRNSLLYYLFGFPFDRLIVFHRWIGRWTFLNMIIHLALYVKRWNEAGLNSMKMLKTPEYMHGLVAFIFTGALMITAYEDIRRKFFNLFYYSHFLFIFIYIFSYLHVPDAFTPYIICIGVFYGFDRVLRLIWGLYITKTIQIRQKADDIIQVRFKKHCLAKYFYRIGQYIFISFPELSVYAFHPFTLSSSPDELSAEVHIRSLGDYTNKLRDRVAKGGSSLYIRTDGPYGNHRFTYRRFPGLILIGGGIGVTPLIAILRDIYRVGDFPPNDNPPAHVIQHVCCVWIVPSIKSFEWFREEITEVYNKINRSKGIYPELSFFVYCSRESDETLQPYRSNSNGTSFVAGRPDMDVLFSDVNQRINGRPVSVFACGPKLMTSAAWDATSTMRLQGFYFNFHHETFDW